MGGDPVEICHLLWHSVEQVRARVGLALFKVLDKAGGRKTDNT